MSAWVVIEFDHQIQIIGAKSAEHAWTKQTALQAGG
jgi:hypothetical protein